MESDSGREGASPDLPALLLAAEGGSIDAAVTLGSMYRSGDGVPQNYREALRWYLSAAERGSIEAEASLGYLYFTGADGVRPDFRESFSWYLKAAEQGDADSEYSAGRA